MNADEKKKKIIMLFIALGLILSVIFGVTFSYLAPSINNVESNSTVAFNAGTIAINYENGQNQINASEVLPGWTSIKEFSLTAINNTTISTSGAMNYAIKLIVEKNTFNDGTITYSIEGENVDNNGTVAYVLPNSLKNGASEVILGYGVFDTSSDISKGVTHKYTLTIAFPNKTYESQNEDLGKTLSAHIIIANEGESTFSNLTIIDDNNNLNKTMILKNNTAYELPNIASKAGAYFSGWNVESENATINGNKITINGNASIKANYSSTNKTEFAYTGKEQIFTAPVTGTYKLETWGAGGGYATYSSTNNPGGSGGYSTGYINISKNENLYVQVGGAGQSTVDATPTSDTGYNGGGYACFFTSNSSHAGGGGATHIATVSGKLDSLSNSISKILIVSGGGGGGSTHNLSPNYSGTGGPGGGYKGGSGIAGSTTCYAYGNGGTQTGPGDYTLCSGDGSNPGSHEVDIIPSAPTFGLGGNYTQFGNSVTNKYYVFAGGGGGYYGGSYGYHAPGGGGSGYIGNSRLYNKAMYCYNCTESSDESTKTVSTTCHSSTPTENCAKEGNGYARITMPEIKEGRGLSTITVVSEELKKVITIEAEKGVETEISVEGLTNSSLGFKSFEIEKGEATINKTKITPLSDTIVVKIFYKVNLEFYYTGTEQIFTVPINGTYKLETWGAQGGVKISGGSSTTGYGGYSVGNITFSKGDIIYINVGGEGLITSSSSTKLNGGYNGGGMGYSYKDSRGGASGGGATHIANTSGLLSTLSSKVSNILIVSGGGGGSDQCCDGYSKVAGSGGGYMGAEGNYGNTIGYGGTQSTGGYSSETGFKGTFGQGGNCDSYDCAGGGGGFYGGGAVIGGGGYGSGGSGYIGNSLLTDKVMYCYNCTESSAESTKTISTTCHSSTPTENCAKEGNGYARIKLIS